MFFLYAQIFSSNGTKIGSEFRINSYDNGPQEHPSLGILSNDDFIIVWDSSSNSSYRGIYGQRFNHEGSMLNSEFVVNTISHPKSGMPSIGIRSDNSFVVVWSVK